MSCAKFEQRGEPRHFCLCICECENEATTAEGFCAGCQRAVDHVLRFGGEKVDETK